MEGMYAVALEDGVILIGFPADLIHPPRRVKKGLNREVVRWIEDVLRPAVDGELLEVEAVGSGSCPTSFAVSENFKREGTFSLVASFAAADEVVEAVAPAEASGKDMVDGHLVESKLFSAVTAVPFKNLEKVDLCLEGQAQANHSNHFSCGAPFFWFWKNDASNAS